MGQERMLLIIISVIFISIAIAVGFFLFGTNAVSSNKDALVNDINHLAMSALQYRARTSSMGGGGGSYTGYVIPGKIAINDDGTFAATVQPQSIVLTGTSKQGYGTVQALLDSAGTLKNFTYTGEF